MSGNMAASGSAEERPLQEQFALFSKFGDTKSDGKTIALSQADKWFKQAQVFDKKLTTTDTGICFKKFKSHKINFSDFQKYIEDLATSKKMEPNDIRKKLQTCGNPGTTKATVVAKNAAVDRLTDTSKYTGSHKERFDESGKGRGKEGRSDVGDNSGYVTGYKAKDTFDKK